jgi:hypothetical protein
MRKGKVACMPNGIVFSADIDRRYRRGLWRPSAGAWPPNFAPRLNYALKFLPMQYVGERAVRRLVAGRDGVADREHRHKFACNFSSKCSRPLQSVIYSFFNMFQRGRADIGIA